ncbi:hypothetical protein D0T84_03605 [Dysgonomonas sp. 521]|uniref:MutS-related protein n=1 Tax=Dysgonomonas sp. 521 TaxID=2302932 RepID=UPI0013D648CC|nr:hypothetical protein [Dysgonomonas sp. 521]NDV94003.1 hypothetical protein [Dysgonomonas sp. 521]
MKQMKFEVDYQTKKDLEIFETVKDGTSVFGLFNHTQCVGGRRKLYEFLSNPLADFRQISERKESIAFLQKHFPAGLSLDKDALDFTEFYLRQPDHPTRMPSWFTAIERMIADKISTNANEYYLAEKGVTSTIDLLKNIHAFSLSLSQKMSKTDAPAHLLKNNEEVLAIFSKPEYKEILDMRRYKSYDIMRFDFMFRNTDKKHILFFLNLVYEYDAFFAVAKAAEKHQMEYPEILPDTQSVLDIQGLFHPFLAGAVGNDVRFDVDSNLLFISGPNMAGKSTFLKALGIAVYLAHVGFPVPASGMKFGILSGLSTTINISDNLNSGYSHFYAEVMRIKDVAEKLKSNNRMMVLFDELFRGTNVKDAYDGTVAIVSALSKIRTSFFVISTHIVEAAEELQPKDNIQFGYFDIRQEDGHPAYTYKLKEGVSDVRLGMYIINKEGLIELINNISNVNQ